jgi:hypothetical protein
MLRLSVVACVLAVAVATPVISLDMDESMTLLTKPVTRTHPLKYVQPDGKAVDSVQKFTMNCAAKSADKCALPNAKAMDHHDSDTTLSNRIERHCYLIHSVDIPKARWGEVACNAIDRTKRSTYEITYDVEDDSKNKADQAFVTMFLFDKQAPKITQCINMGQKFEATSLGNFCRGTTAKDNVDNYKPKKTLRYTIVKQRVGTSRKSEIVCNKCTIAQAALRTDRSITFWTGKYTVYTFSHDFAGRYGKSRLNNKSEIKTVFEVQDTTGPVITLIGSDSVKHECATQYKDEGATGSDALDNALFSVTKDKKYKIQVHNNHRTTVDDKANGAYKVKFWAKDSHGNQHQTSTVRNVKVVDTTNPVINVGGHKSKKIVHEATEGKPAHAEQASKCFDTCDKRRKVTAFWKGTQFNDRKIGKYTRVYTCSDKSGNKDTEYRTYEVVDKVKPLITCNNDPSSGKCTVVLEASRDSRYTDAGAKCRDYVDSHLPVRISGDVVAMRTPATYKIHYDCKDKSGNNAPRVTRKVIVQDTTRPVISLKGKARITLEAGFPYADAGATATDTLDGDITKKIKVSGNDVDVKSSFINHYSCAEIKAEAANPINGNYIITTPNKQRVEVYCDFKYKRTYLAVTSVFRVAPYGSNPAGCTLYGYVMAFSAKTVGKNAYKAAKQHFLEYGQEESPYFPTVAGATSNKYLCSPPEAASTGLNTRDYLSLNSKDWKHGASPGDYYIVYKVTDKANNAQKAVVKRFVKVVDTLPPVISLHYAQKVKNHRDKTWWSDRYNSNPASRPVRAIKGHNPRLATKGTNPFLHFMAESTSVNGWMVGAIASAITGIALLGFSSKTQATTVPV